ncbi:MAG: NAD(P)-dependent oxidoreductase [Bacilli bacterium]
MKHVIISGSTGFVGRNTVKYFVEKKVKVLALTTKKGSKYEVKSPYVRYLEFDMRNPFDYLSKIKVNKYDTFIHLAWRGTSGEERNDYNLQMNNVKATLECMKFAEKLGCKRFICAGSIMEYEVKQILNDNKIDSNFLSIYSLSKYMLHCYCKAISSQINVEIVWATITNTFGVGEESNRFINTTIKKIIRKENLVFTSGFQNYDFVYIDDVARAFFLISKYGKNKEEYIIGSSKAQPLRNFILEIINELNPIGTVEFGKISYSGVNLELNNYCSPNLLNDCGFKTEISFREGIRKTYIWLRESELENE